MTFRKKIETSLRLIIFNPILFFLYLKKFFVDRFYPPLIFKPKIYQKNINGVIFEFFSVGEPLFGSQIFFNNYEIATVKYMKSALKPGDVFIDIGAHIGYLSAVGASLVGKNGQVHSFEPVPPTFQYLKLLAQNNPKYKFFLNNCAVGDRDDTVEIEYQGPKHSGGSSAISGFSASHGLRAEEIFKARIIRLDDYILKNNIKKIGLIKIDVEGYEFLVLKGLENYFKDTGCRPPIICEITPSAYKFLGLTREQLIDYMRQYRYHAYGIYTPSRRVDITKLEEGENVIWRIEQNDIKIKTGRNN